jgi:membrane protease YdiL (CAAX protease family)
VGAKLGEQLTGPRRRAVAAAVGTAAVLGDLALVRWDRYQFYADYRWPIALVAAVTLLHLARGDAASVGLAPPAQGWWYWVRMTLLIGLLAAVCMAAGVLVWVAAGLRLPVGITPPAWIGAALVRMCVYAPLLEETIYRLVLCVPLAALGRPWLAVILSGLVFGALHVAYGNASPENALGGFFLAWAFLRSGSVYVPVLLHSLGNLVILAGQVGIWYWYSGPG